MKKRSAEQVRLDIHRESLNEPQNHVVDEWLHGRLSRRGFLRVGTAYGLGSSMIGACLAATGLSLPTGARAAGKPGGTVRVALSTPPSAIDPVHSGDASAATLLMQTGECLLNDSPSGALVPMLALSWSPDTTGAVWTFKLRRGVKFQNGQPMTADDVVATFERLTDPKIGSNALTAFAGVLSKGGTRKVDDYTVEFHLDAPNGNFPYFVSADNYNAIILPRNYAGNYEKDFIGTGPFKLETFTPKRSASFVRNPDYWGDKALPDRTVFTFFPDFQSQMLAMQGRQVDVLAQLPLQGNQAITHNPSVKVIRLRSSINNQMHMRCDTGPFKDKRVRQAMALCLNREAIVSGLLGGMADIGNDHPFAPIFRSGDSTVPQRKQDIAKAKRLMASAGVPNGFPVTLTAEQYLEIPAFAQVVQDSARQIGITINLKIESQDTYFGKAVFGQSDWLDVAFGITDYGHRGTPNLFLSELTTSNGWNAAHFKEPAYDKLVSQYMSTLDLTAQRKISHDIETMLQDETPVIFAYFSNFLMATSANLGGVVGTAGNQLLLANASFS